MDALQESDPKPDLRPGHWCYYVPADQDPATHGGYVPSVVADDDDGHYPMIGNGPCASPWVWGKTLEQAQATAKWMNAQMGVSVDDAAMIVMKSMALKNFGRAKRRLDDWRRAR